MFSFDLRALADRTGPDRAFLSIYLHSEEDRGLLDARFNQIRSFLAGQPDELEHFEENVKLIQPLLDAPFQDESRAAFACWALDYREGHDLPVEVPTLVRVDSSPYVRPLAEMEDEYEDFAVVVADNKAASVYLVSAAEMEREGRVRGDVKNAVKKGGWSQKRYARRREKELERYATDVAGQLEELHREHPFGRLVVLGQDEAMRAVTEALSGPMGERIVGERSIDVQADERETERVAFDLYFDGEREEEEALWDQIKAGVLSDGLGVAGANRVLKALQMGRVDTLMVARDAEIEGSRCRDCENLARGLPKTCYQCGSKDLFAVDLVNELVELAAQTSADVDFVDPFDGLAEVGHVAALLRY
jgi:peptide chain release factor subunit 1